MAWSAATILARARAYASKYSDADAELDMHYVQVAFEQFCLDTLWHPVKQMITTVANQREYTHSVVRVRRVLYDGQELPILPDSVDTPQRHVALYPSRVVLSFSPTAGRSIVVEGYGVPSSIDGLMLQPEQQLMDAVAMLAAVKYLAVYADQQTQSRTAVLLSQYQSVVQQFKERHADSVRSVDIDNWSALSILARAREFARRYTERVDDLNMHYVQGAWQQFCLDTNAFEVEYTVLTIGNQREYAHPLVRVFRVYLGGDELVLLPEPNAHYRACAVYPNRIVLSFDPDPYIPIRILGTHIPAIDDVLLEPASRLMDGIAMLAAYTYLIRFAEPAQLQSISLYQLEYRRVVEDFQRRHYDAVRRRGQPQHTAGWVDLL